METVGAYEAKTHLSSLLERVARGEQFTITKHGVPVAILLPADPQKQVDVADVIARLRLFQSEHSTGGISIREMIEEGRR